MELNLENPIFVYYLNTKGMSTMRIQQYIDQYFSNIKNITMWIVPTEKNQKLNVFMMEVLILILRNLGNK